MSRSHHVQGTADTDVLEPVGRGVQGDVFGTQRWVVKIRRFSILGLLARWVSNWRCLVEVKESLGGLAAPFLVLDEVAFRAPKMGGRGRIVALRRRRAVARERYVVDAFLDHQLSIAEPPRALALVEEMVVLVERVRARGFYMHDFIMRNFVLVDGRLLIADTGLITPMRSFWEPAVRLCARGFSKGLSKDYQRLLAEVRDEVREDPALCEQITAFTDALPERLGRLRSRSVAGLESEPAAPVSFDPELEKEIRQVLQPVR